MLQKRNRVKHFREPGGKSCCLHVTLRNVVENCLFFFTSKHTHKKKLYCFPFYKDGHQSHCDCGVTLLLKTKENKTLLFFKFGYNMNLNLSHFQTQKVSMGFSNMFILNKQLTILYNFDR